MTNITGDLAANQTTLIKDVDVTAIGFTIGLRAAPGAGKSVRVVWRSYRP